MMNMTTKGRFQMHETDKTWLDENGFIKSRENKNTAFFARSLGKTVITVGVPLNEALGCFAAISLKTDGWKPIISERKESAKEAVHEVLDELNTMANDISEIRDFLFDRQKQSL